MTPAKATTDWFDDRPLELSTVCTRLKEAVEEREMFYRITVPTSWYPLELPKKPFCNFDTARETLRDPKVNYIRNFSKNLYYRVNNLLRNSFDPLKFGKWCDTGYLESYDAQQTLLQELGIDSDAFHAAGLIGGGHYRNTLPLRYENMRYFHAIADVLNRCCLYPAPPAFRSNFRQNQGCVFGLDGIFAYRDILGGTSEEVSVQPEAIKVYPEGGGYITFSAERPAGYTVKLEYGKLKYEYSYKASKLKIFYNTNVPEYSSPYTGDRDLRVPLQGSFKVKMLMNGSFENIEGTSTLRDEQILTPVPGGAGCDISLEWCSSQLAKCTESSLQDIKKSSIASMRFECKEILLEKENYPSLPYKYLTNKI